MGTILYLTDYMRAIPSHEYDEDAEVINIKSIAPIKYKTWNEIAEKNRLNEQRLQDERQQQNYIVKRNHSLNVKTSQ